MNKNTFLSIAVILLVIGCIIATRSCMSQKASNSTVAYNDQHKNDSTSHYRDLYNAEHGTRLAAEGNYSDLMATYQQEMDSAAKRLQIDKRQIEGLQKAVAAVKGNFSAIVHHDTINNWFAYRDSNIYETATLTGDSVHVDYEISVPINLTQYWHRPWLLGKKVHYVDGYSSNPNAHITGLQSVRVNGKEPGRFGIGPYVGIGINMRPSTGLALTYSLFRF